jgi:hypothetical protein
MNKYEEVEKNGALAKGKAELLSHLNKISLTARQAILAKCYDCMGYFADGRVDCQLTTCSLYPFMQYSSAPRIKRVMSESQRESARKRFKDLHQAKKGA